MSTPQVDPALRIVQTLPGQSTTGHDDRFITADGRVWQRTPAYYLSGTTVEPPRYMIWGNHLVRR